MRPSRLRFTIRRLIVAAAIAGGLFAVVAAIGKTAGPVVQIRQWLIGIAAICTAIVLWPLSTHSTQPK